MQNIKLIIGANYGDEGKGLAADFFGAGAAGRFNAINVLTNGGPQRGHTVELSDSRRHVFKHFGAASFRGAASYFAEQFIVNPMEFMREYDDLCAVHEAPEAYMNPRCRFSTPWDMLTNQLFLGKKRPPQQLRIRDLGDCTAISERIRNFLRNLCGNEQ